ncbi:MAG: glycoside hydrolase family 2 protein, partial [Oscillospiraceae bacterium]|nr:glycoside hydrolase family 2 protein [Oscillospiraceae bacterium]
YRNHLFRYVSEFGFQSFPCMDTIESFTAPEDRNVFSYVMEKHQRNASANGRIVSYISQMYLYPGDLDKLVYASQLLQAQAMQYGVEHWRRNRGRCMGAVVWQLNDCWPVASWASIDYFGRWKALHYYEKRFFAPVLISCHEEGILSQNTNVNAEPFALEKSAHLNVSNETLQAFKGTARWALRRPDASVIMEGCFPVEVPAMSAVWLPKQDFSNQDTYGCYYSYELVDEDGSLVGDGSVLFCPPKHFRFEDPKLNAFINGDEIIVTAEGYARSVEIQCGADVLLEDNYFDMNGGTKAVKILRGQPDCVSVRSVYDIR